MKIMCNKLSLQDDECNHITSTTNIATSVVGTIFFVLLIIMLLGLGAAAVYFYRKRLRRDMNKEVKMQVETAVGHYYALS
jgi:cbb3-type cytochrome oxidase subunit 3